MEQEKKKHKSRDETGSNMDELKEEYNKLKEKHSLPEFYELNKLFDIEEIDTETEFLLRKIRRVVSERIASYLRFIELILNPSNAPMFFFKLIKRLESNDRDELTKIYEKLGNFELDVISLDLEYNEEKEAIFIKKVFDIFNNEARLSLLGVINKLSLENNDSKKIFNGSYFG